MELKIKPFAELTKRELYEILRLRMEVFVVEQGGRYQDLDGIDYRSIHIFEENEAGEVVGCVRIFLKPDEPGTVQVGRLAAKDRMTGLGRRLMEAAREEAKKQLNAKRLYLTGRASAYGFYRKCGYSVAPGDELPEGTPYYILRREA